MEIFRLDSDDYACDFLESDHECRTPAKWGCEISPGESEFACDTHKHLLCQPS